MKRRWLLALGAASTTWWTWRHCSSPAVSAWSSPGGERRQIADLCVRVDGTGDNVVVLLHGMMSSGDSFGASYDSLARDHRLVVPDLLGFGRSLALGRSSFGLDDHLDALDSMVDGIGLTGARWTVGGHSMGGILALHWAGRRADRVDRVVTWGAPLQTSREAALAAIARMGHLERFFVVDTPVARAVCAWSCRQRSLAGWLAAATNPEMPVALARQSSLHSWLAYRGALEDVILASDCQPALETLKSSGVQVVLTRGTDDEVADPAVLAELASRYPNVETMTHPTAGHDLPVADPGWCIRQLLG